MLNSKLKIETIFLPPKIWSDCRVRAEKQTVRHLQYLIFLNHNSYLLDYSRFNWPMQIFEKLYRASTTVGSPAHPFGIDLYILFI